MRAASPVESGQLSTRGFRISYEVFGDLHAPAVLLLPTWQIAPSLHWKLQVPYLARSFRVATFDPPGIGGAERTAEPAAFELDRVVDYGVDLHDHLDVGRASVVGLSSWSGGCHDHFRGYCRPRAATVPRRAGLVAHSVMRVPGAVNRISRASSSMMRPCRR